MFIETLMLGFDLRLSGGDLHKGRLNKTSRTKQVLCTLFISIFLLPNLANAECYVYDQLGRLMQVNYDNDQANRSYIMDDHGNRTYVLTHTAGGAICDPPSGTGSSGDTSPETSADYENESSSGSGSTNTPPVADNEFISLVVNSIIAVQPLEGDTDADNDVLTLQSISDNSLYFTAVKSGNSVMVSSAGSGGTGVITYVVSDNNGGTGTGTISVTVTDSGGGGGGGICDLYPELPSCGGGGGTIPQ